MKMSRSDLWQNTAGATTQAGKREEEEEEEEQSNTKGNKHLDRRAVPREMLYLNPVSVPREANKVRKQTPCSRLPPTARCRGRNRSCEFS